MSLLKVTRISVRPGSTAWSPAGGSVSTTTGRNCKNGRGRSSDRRCRSPRHRGAGRAKPSARVIEDRGHIGVGGRQIIRLESLGEAEFEHEPRRFEMAAADVVRERPAAKYVLAGFVADGSSYSA